MDDNWTNIQKVRSGDERAFLDLLKQNEKLIYKIIYQFILNNGDYRADIEDLYQEGSIALYQCCFTYNENFDVKFSTYAFSYMKKKISTRYRNTFKKYSKEYYSIEEMERIDYMSCFTVQDNPIKYHKEKEFEDYLNKFIDTLQADEKQIIELRKEDYTYKEISERLNMNVKKVDNKLTSLRKKLKRYLENE